MVKASGFSCNTELFYHELAQEYPWGLWVVLLDVFLGLENALEVTPHKLLGRQKPARHGLLHVINRSLMQRETAAGRHREQVN